MWMLVGVILFFPWGEMQPTDESELMQQAPAHTQEACHIAAYDRITEWLRQKGMSVDFNATCEQST